LLNESYFIDSSFDINVRLNTSRELYSPSCLIQSNRNTLIVIYQCNRFNFCKNIANSTPYKKEVMLLSILQVSQDYRLNFSSYS